MEGYQIQYPRHAIIRMQQRKIIREEVIRAISEGEIIKTYPDDTPYPSELILYWSGKRPLHIVVATNADLQEKIVITAYQPDSGLWEKDFRRKRP